MKKASGIVAIVAAAALGLGACAAPQKNVLHQEKLEMPNVVGNFKGQIYRNGILAKLYDFNGDGEGDTIWYYKKSGGQIEDKPFGVFMDGHIFISCNYPYEFRDKTISGLNLTTEKVPFLFNVVCGYDI